MFGNLFWKRNKNTIYIYKLLMKLHIYYEIGYNCDPRKLRHYRCPQGPKKIFTGHELADETRCYVIPTVYGSWSDTGIYSGSVGNSCGWRGLRLLQIAWLRKRCQDALGICGTCKLHGPIKGVRRSDEGSSDLVSYCCLTKRIFGKDEFLYVNVWNKPIMAWARI